MKTIIYSNARNTISLIRKGNSNIYRANGALDVITQSEADYAIESKNLVPLPLKHRMFILSIIVNEQLDRQLDVTVTLEQHEKMLPGVWVRGTIQSRNSPRFKCLPCFFTFIPKRIKRGVYEYTPVVEMVCENNGELSMYRQVYDRFEPIESTALKEDDFHRLGFIGESKVSRIAS